VLRGSVPARLPGLLELETVMVITKPKTPTPTRRTRAAAAEAHSRSSRGSKKPEGKSSRQTKRTKPA
jgi:hypothetical protein